MIFQFYFDIESGRWQEWREQVQAFEYDEDELFDVIIVPTTETVKQNHILDLHVKERKPVLYVGTAGTAKTTSIRNYFTTVNKEVVQTATINFNSYTDSAALQFMMEDKVEKRAGRTFGPPPNCILIYFMDDLNMPYVDKYGT